MNTSEKNSKRNAIRKVVNASPVMPVMVIKTLVSAIPLADALLQGGINTLEITLRTPIALEAIAKIKQAFPNAIVGAGTIITPQDIDNAVLAGVDFLVSPGTSTELLEALKHTDTPALPGVASPSEAMRLYEEGFDHLKFFPAEAAGGVAMLKSINGPLPNLTFCPTGGITPDNAPSYLALPNVRCVGGSWLAPESLIVEKRWDEISELARQAATL